MKNKCDVQQHMTTKLKVSDIRQEHTKCDGVKHGFGRPTFYLPGKWCQNTTFEQFINISCKELYSSDLYITGKPGTKKQKKNPDRTWQGILIFNQYDQIYLH